MLNDCLADDLPLEGLCIPLWFDAALAVETLAATGVAVSADTIANRLEDSELRGHVRREGRLWRVMEAYRYGARNSLTEEQGRLVARRTLDAYRANPDLYEGQLGPRGYATSVSVLTLLAGTEPGEVDFGRIVAQSRTGGRGVLRLAHELLSAAPGSEERAQQLAVLRACIEHLDGNADRAKLLLMEVIQSSAPETIFDTASTLLERFCLAQTRPSRADLSNVKASIAEADGDFEMVFRIAGDFVASYPDSIGGTMVCLEPLLRRVRNRALKAGRQLGLAFDEAASEWARSVIDAHPPAWVGQLWGEAKHTTDEVWLFELLFSNVAMSLVVLSDGYFANIHEELVPLAFRDSQYSTVQGILESCLPTSVPSRRSIGAELLDSDAQARFDDAVDRLAHARGSA